MQIAFYNITDNVLLLHVSECSLYVKFTIPWFISFGTTLGKMSHYIITSRAAFSVLDYASLRPTIVFHSNAFFKFWQNQIKTYSNETELRNVHTDTQIYTSVGPNTAASNMPVQDRIRKTNLNWIQTRQSL